MTRIPRPTKSAKSGLSILVEYLRIHQGEQETSQLFAGRTTRQREDIHAAIDWVYLVTRSLEIDQN